MLDRANYYLQKKKPTNLNYFIIITNLSEYVRNKITHKLKKFNERGENKAEVDIQSQKKEIFSNINMNSNDNNKCGINLLN